MVNLKFILLSPIISGQNAIIEEIDTSGFVSIYLGPIFYLVKALFFDEIAVYRKQKSRRGRTCYRQ